jgi:hypothetical protein
VARGFGDLALVDADPVPAAAMGATTVGGVRVARLSGPDTAARRARIRLLFAAVTAGVVRNAVAAWAALHRLWVCGPFAV